LFIGARQRRRIGSEITHFVQQGDCRAWERRIAASDTANFPDELDNRINGRGLVGSSARAAAREVLAHDSPALLDAPTNWQEHEPHEQKTCLSSFRFSSCRLAKS
jgi:hypothetical protein